MTTSSCRSAITGPSIILAVLITVVVSIGSASADTYTGTVVPVRLISNCVDVENQLVTSLSRRVVETDGKPIVSAQISVQDNAGKVLLATKTDAKGKYAIRGLNSGTYHVVLTAVGYRPFEYTLVIAGKPHRRTSFVQLRPATECGKVEPVESLVEPMDAAEYCLTVEHVTPNLHLLNSTQVQGRLIDQSGASFGNSRVEVRRYVSESEQVSVKSVTTDSNGGFDLGEIAAGEYRLLASPSRAFSQSEEIWCSAERKCFLGITVKVNPTDLPASRCPIR